VLKDLVDIFRRWEFDSGVHLGLPLFLLMNELYIKILKSLSPNEPVPNSKQEIAITQIQ
jgi:hypothetical protein